MVLVTFADRRDAPTSALQFLLFAPMDARPLACFCSAQELLAQGRLPRTRWTERVVLVELAAARLAPQDAN